MYSARSTELNLSELRTSSTCSKWLSSMLEGLELTAASFILRVRYVPDDTSFEDDPINDEATEATVAAAGAAYQGVEFVTDVSLLQPFERLATY